MRKVLFADDEPLFVEAIVQRLQARGWTVLVAHDGTETLESLQKEKDPGISLVILDVMMSPGPALPEIQDDSGTGLHVLQKIKETPSLADIPVVLLTVLGHDPAVMDFASRFGVLVVAKTEPLDRLFSAIERALEPKQGK
jgi:CheY-like chemotaxis protein